MPAVLLGMAQAVNDMLQGVGLVMLATFGSVILLKVGMNRLFR